MSKLEYKYAPFSLKTSEDGRGEFTGCANFCGYLDDGGDIIPQGGFNSALPEFLKGGFIAHSHEWNIKDGVIGYPVEAHEDENGLFIKGKFHSTNDAQDVRTKMKERADDGLDVGLSIGYRGGTPIFIYPKDYEKELPKYLKPDFLTEGLQKAKRFKNVRVLPKLSQLKEVSVVTSPMNILSSIDGVKSDRELSEREQEMKAQWTSAYIDSLPDSAFAFIESGGDKDSEGKTTPRSLRHFPYKDANGNLDEAHIRNALARIPQSNVSADGKSSALKTIQAAAKKVGIEMAKNIMFAPLETEWNEGDALVRLREWAEKQEEPDAAYARAFLLPDNNGVHRFPFADIVDDKLVYVEQGLSKATDDFIKTFMPASVAAKLRGRISAYYAKVASQFPTVDISIDWEDEGDEVTSEIQTESFKNTCLDLGLDVKVGARNAGADRQRIKQMHDLAVQMQPDVCPGYASKSIIVAEIKEIFDEELSKITTANPYAVWSAFCETLRRIKQIKASANGQVDTDAMLEQAIKSMTDQLQTAAFAELNKDQTDGDMAMGMYGNSKPTEQKDGDTEPVDLAEWKAQRFKTEKLKTGALRQRAGLPSGLGGA